MSGTRIDLFLHESGNEVERAVVDGKVSVKLPELVATGMHLVYTQANDTYVLTGEPASLDPEGRQGELQADRRQHHHLRSADPARSLKAFKAWRRRARKPLDACLAELGTEWRRCIRAT